LAGGKGKKLTAAVILAVLFILTALLADDAARVMYPLKYRELVKKYSEMYDLDPYLVLSVIKTESGFRHTAVSRKNAMGLMQITRGTGEWSAEKIGLQDFTADMLFDPETNIKIGCWYLSRLYTEFGDTELVLAAYNAGSGNVSRWLNDKELSPTGKTLDKIPFRETEEYLKKVRNSYLIYKKLYENVF
jgi:soluble lytic murein transglycosylase